MNSFEKTVLLLPLALSAGGMRYLLKWSGYEQVTQSQHQDSAISDGGVVLKGRRIGCELPDTTLIQITPSQVRIYGPHSCDGPALAK